MTGFGLAEVEEDGLSVRVEIRSVNHRFLQVRQRLPQDFGDIEPKLEALLRKRLSRGAVMLNASLVRSAPPEAVAVDGDVARRYQTLLRGLARELSIPDDLSLSTLVHLPGVIAVRTDEHGRRREAAVLLAAAEEALGHLLESRAAEGRGLERDLLRNAKAIQKLRVQVEKRMPAVVRAHMQNLERRVSELLGNAAAVQPGDLARELAMLADRMDVSEELSRIESHVERLATVLEKGGAAGRELDFLAQELFREANTVGSKCNDATVAHAVVELKTHIERLREQVQNVE